LINNDTPSVLELEDDLSYFLFMNPPPHSAEFPRTLTLEGLISTKANVAAENRFDKMQSLVSKQA
jgi:hypothetical protein